MSLAMLYYETGRYTEAIDLYTRVIDSGADGESRGLLLPRRLPLQPGGQGEGLCGLADLRCQRATADAAFIVRNYCDTDEESIPKKPVRKRKNTRDPVLRLERVEC